MITAIRASKRIALGGFIGFALFFVCLLAVKDMNDKLGVMTASNAGYQKMTDSQADKIKMLQSELDSVRASKVSELKSAHDDKEQLSAQIEEMRRKFNALSKENRDCQAQKDTLSEAKSTLESERNELKRLNDRQRQDGDRLSIQLRDQIAKLSVDRDSCQSQYAALYKLHQQVSDNIANLSNEKQKLEMKLVGHAIAPESSTKSSKQLPLPVASAHGRREGQMRPAVQKQRSSSMQPVGLEEPHLPRLQMSTSKGGSHLAPVGAEPPLHGQPEVVQLHNLRKEDVMEAPKVMQHFESLDAQVDPVQHDHPGLQAPVYRDNQNVAFDEDDLEDTADGQLPLDYIAGDQKVLKIVKLCTNHSLNVDKIFFSFQAGHQRYDQSVNDLDYDDFQADFRPHKQKQPIRQNDFHPQHKPIIIPHQQQQFLAPQIQHGAQPQFHYRRGL